MNAQIEKISPIAKTYAEALSLVVKDGKASYESIANDLNIIVEAFSSSKDLQISMENTAIDLNIKFDIINGLFEGKISSEMINFLKTLVEKKHIQELGQINKAFTNILYEVKNIQAATIFSAVELSSSQKQHITEVLTRKLNKSIVPDWEIDRDLIAGLKVKLDDNVLDLSLKNKIEKLEKSLLLK